MDSNQELERKQEQEEYVAVGENGVSGEMEAPEDHDGAGEAQQTITEGGPKPEKQEKGKSGRRDILHILCGAYLLYLTYKLIPGFLEGDSWTAMRVVSLVGAIVFGVVGVVLLVGVVRRFIEKTKNQTK